MKLVSCTDTLLQTGATTTKVMAAKVAMASKGTATIIHTKPITHMGPKAKRRMDTVAVSSSSKVDTLPQGQLKILLDTVDMMLCLRLEMELLVSICSH